MENKNTHVVYGFITGLVIVIIQMSLYLSGLTFRADMKYVSYLPFIPFLIGIIMNAKAYSKAHDGFVTFGNVFGNCFKAVMIVTLVMVAWSVISMNIFPEMKEKALAMARDEMVRQNKMNDEQMDTALNITRKYWNVIMIAGGLFTNLLFGAILSLIAAAVVPKKGAQPLVPDNG